MSRTVDCIGKLVTSVDEYFVLAQAGRLFVGTPVQEVIKESEFVYPVPCVIEPYGGFDFLRYPRPLSIKVQKIEE